MAHIIWIVAANVLVWGGIALSVARSRARQARRDAEYVRRAQEIRRTK